jgi:glycosyltransferase involved in cell wall biosynthesis
MLIILASVLKSCEDVRLYHKIAHSIAKSGVGKVEVWGQGNLFRFKRLGIRRIWANLTFFLALWRAKPSVVIVATFELLPAGVLYKWLKGGKLGYDVQENYIYNVLYTRVFPIGLRYVLAFWIRAIEKCALPFVDFVWVAEKCYLTEMLFLQKKAVFLPNKTLIKPEPLGVPNIEEIKMLYSGNVSIDYGVVEAIHWVKSILPAFPNARLYVVGHCPKAEDFQALQGLASQHSFLTLEIQETPIAHETIVAHMRQADWLLMPYQINKSVAGRIPTKFYEALALGKRMIVTEHGVWQTFMQDFPESVILWTNFALPASPEMLQNMKKAQEILPTPYTEGVVWEMEDFSSLLLQ